MKLYLDNMGIDGFGAVREHKKKVDGEWCVTWAQEVEPGRVNGPQYRINPTSGRVITQKGPGNCHDKGLDFDLGALLAKHPKLELQT